MFEAFDAQSQSGSQRTWSHVAGNLYHEQFSDGQTPKPVKTQSKPPGEPVKPDATGDKPQNPNLTNLTITDDKGTNDTPPKDETADERQVRLERARIQLEREQLALEKEKYEFQLKQAQDALELQRRNLEMMNGQQDRETEKARSDERAKREAEQNELNQIRPTNNNTGQQKGSSMGTTMPQPGMPPSPGQPSSGPPGTP